MNHRADESTTESGAVPGVDRRRLLAWGGLATAGAVVAGAPPADAATGHAGTTGPSGGGRVPPDTRPGGAYDRYVAKLAAEGRFAGVVLLSHRGRTVLSRSYGMADEERGVRIREDTAFTLSSAGKPLHAVAVLQLAQQGRLALTDPVGRHLTGFDPDVAERVTIHHLLLGVSGLGIPDEDIRRVFGSRQEVQEYRERWARQARLVGTPGTPTSAHDGSNVIIPALIVQAVSGMTYWDYVEEHIFRRCGMTGSAFYTRPQWLTDERIAHPYLTVAPGTRVDALRNLDRGSSLEHIRGRNPGRAFIDTPGDGGFATAPDLARLVHAIGDGTVLERPWGDVLNAPKQPQGPAAFGAYGTAADIVGGQWMNQRTGGDAGVGANWSSYPDTGWVGVILTNRDDTPLLDIMEQETLAVTGARPAGGGGG